MQAGEANLMKFIKSSEQFIIPIYQRMYSWTHNECKQLWDDIIRAGKNEDITAHFIGSIVYVSKGIYQVTSIKPLLVIDGQQRLTTLLILFSAIRDYLNENKIENEVSAEKINAYFLMNEKEEGEDRYKLILTRNDKEAFFKIVENKKHEGIGNSRVKENYDFFKSKISNLNIHDLYKGISKLAIIDVSLDRERDNPQLIFESLNSTGLELTQADLIRNYILMGLEKKEQEELYSDYWHKMENNFGHIGYSEKFDRFVRDYLTIKTGKIPNINEVYGAFKQFSQSYKNIKDLVEDLYKYSEYFVNVALEKEKETDLNEIFKDINFLKVDVSYPFILQMYNDYKENLISKIELVEILKLIESYVFRRAICGIPTNSLNKTFANLYKEIDKNNYLESIKANFLVMDSYKRLPSNEEFKEQLEIKDVYNFRNRNYLLRKLENNGKKELINVEKFTIEHIMPQKENLTPQWQKELGENWKEIQEKYLHTLGNLTLTGYNSELSCKSFNEKRNMEGGFANSPLKLNRTLGKLNNWDKDKIIERAKELSNLAVIVWNIPILSSEALEKYKPQKEAINEANYTLIDHPFLFENEPMFEIFKELRKRILNIDSSVKEEIKKLYIAYKSATNFVDIVPQKSKLRLSLNIGLNEINDPENRTKDVSNLGRWGNGDIEFGLNKMEDIDYAIFLIKQAFDKVSEGN